MNFQSFENKWSSIRHTSAEGLADERSLYVPPGFEPQTQRQLNLYSYFLFIKSYVEGSAYTDIAEIGCGRGTIGLYLAHYLKKKMTMLDSASDAIKVAEDLFRDHGCQGTFLVGDALEMQLPDQSFDAVVSIGLAEHLDDVEKLYAEQYRLLRPGGMMISLNIPRKRSIQQLNIVMRSIKKLLGTYKQSVHSDYYRNSYKPDEYASFARAVGFADVTITNVCPFPLFTPIKMSTDKKITKIYRSLIRLRSRYMAYTYKSSYPLSQAHFLVGKKPKYE